MFFLTSVISAWRPCVASRFENGSSAPPHPHPRGGGLGQPCEHSFPPHPPGALRTRLSSAACALTPFHPQLPSPLSQRGGLGREPGQVQNKTLSWASSEKHLGFNDILAVRENIWIRVAPASRNPWNVTSWWGVDGPAPWKLP